MRPIVSGLALALAWSAVPAPIFANQVVAGAGAGAVPLPTTSPTNDARYTAFDLEAKVIATSSIPADASPGANLRSLCTTSVAGGELTVTRSPSAICEALFDAQRPPDLWLELMVPSPGSSPVLTSWPLVFDRGVPSVFKAVFDPATQRIDMQNGELEGFLVFHSSLNHRWTKVEISKGAATMPSASEGISAETKLYLRLRFKVGGVVRLDDDVFEVDWKVSVPPAAPPDTSCDIALNRARTYDWAAVLDSKPTTGALEIVHHPTRLPDGDPFAGSVVAGVIGGAVVEPNSFGLVVVRHASTHVVTFDSGPIKLSPPGFMTGLGQSGTADSREAAGVPPAPAPVLVCTTHQVGPHAPGPFKVKVTLVEPRAPTSATISERSIDLVVVRRYLGAFRVGIAAIGGASDQSFEGRTAPGSATAEIVRTKSTPVELVLGYSVYFSSLGGGRGRSYFTLRGEARQDSRGGAFLGFGAASYSAQNIDYLKSLHLGLEYELGPHVAIAVTGVFRRVNHLAAGASVGAPAGMTIPTEEHYDLGGAVVLNISPSFFKFPATNPE